MGKQRLREKGNHFLIKAAGGVLNGGVPVAREVARHLAVAGVNLDVLCHATEPHVLVISLKGDGLAWQGGITKWKGESSREASKRRQSHLGD